MTTGVPIGRRITIECHRANTTTALRRQGDGPNGAKSGSSYGFVSLLVFKVGR